jgi:hypothetical protein
MPVRNHVMAILLLIVMPFMAASQVRKFPPQDESGKDPSLKAFVVQLKQIIKTKDAKRLLTIIHPRVKIDFDDGNGIQHFINTWKPEDPASKVWPIMNKIVAMGGVFSRPDNDPFYKFVFPYVNAIDFEDPDLYFNTLVATARDIPVREKPDENANVVGKLNFDVVTHDYEKSSLPYWYFIQTMDSKIKGYVQADFVYSPVDYRMFLTKEGGRWMISCLVAGD